MEQIRKTQSKKGIETELSKKETNRKWNKRCQWNKFGIETKPNLKQIWNKKHEWNETKNTQKLNEPKQNWKWNTCCLWQAFEWKQKWGKGETVSIEKKTSLNSPSFKITKLSQYSSGSPFPIS